MRQVTKVSLSGKFPDAAGAVLSWVHPILSQPFAAFPCWVLVLALAAEPRAAVSHRALCDSNGSVRARALLSPWPWQCRSIPCAQPGLQSAACSTKSEINPSGSAVRLWEILTPCRYHSACLFGFSHFSPQDVHQEKSRPTKRFLGGQ